MKKFQADLHVHTVLSPCAEIEMLPPLIISEAIRKGINLIAITDHNASANIESVQKAARKSNVTVLPGMELQTKEEVHVLCLFDSLSQINDFQNFVNLHLPSTRNRSEFFGEQLIVDEKGDFIQKEDRLLITSTSITFEEAYNKVNELGGLFIPAHVNRKVNGLLEILGIIPDNIPLVALEISRHLTVHQAMEKFSQIKPYAIIQNGDVHSLSEFIGSTIYNLEEPSINEIKLALQNLDGRSFHVIDKKYL